MKQTALVVTLVAVVALASCHRGPKPQPPAPPPPARPSQPPPAPPPPTPDLAPVPDEEAAVRAKSIDDINQMGILSEIHFDYDKADIREGDRAILNRNAENLKKFYFLKVTVEGHCDERGTVEYNLALGEKRAKAARDYLASLGISGDRLKTVSYGKEVPLCHESSEDCFGRNRRAHFTVTGKNAER